MGLIYYGENCADPGNHICNPCPDLQFGKIRGFATFKSGFTLADPTDDEEWRTGIQDGNIEIIPNLHGSFNATTAKTVGYGNRISTPTYTDCVLTVFDGEAIPNIDFNNKLKKLNNRKLAFVTENYVFLSSKVVSFMPALNIEDNQDSVIELQTVAEWRQNDIPIGYAIPADVFECFAETGV